MLFTQYHISNQKGKLEIALEKAGCHSNSGVCSWVIKDSDGDVGLSPLNPCHASFSDTFLSRAASAKDKNHIVWTSVRTIDTEKSETRAYVDFLVGPDSPYVNHVKAEYEEKYDLIRIDNVDVVPANIMMNFLISTRMPYENPHTVFTWKLLVDKGVDSRAAFALAFNFTIKGNSVFVRTPSTHYPINPLAKVLENIVKARPNSKNVSSLRDGGRYTPCNTIWETNNSYITFEAFGSALHNLLLHKKNFSYNGKFPKIYESAISNYDGKKEFSLSNFLENIEDIKALLSNKGESK